MERDPPISSVRQNSGSPDYAWQRFWVPNGGVIDISDGGFLVDPLLHTSGLFDANLNTLSGLFKYRALALLGEPGMGKSNTIRAEALRLKTASPSGDVISLLIDLREFSSEDRLYRKVFETAEFQGWRDGTSHLVLHLDSLDEALLRIETVAALLASALPNLQCERLSFRVACRTVPWPDRTLRPILEEIWGQGAVGVLELAPLRRIDVVHAARARGIDPERFLESLRAAKAIPFAIKPLTLDLLFRLFEDRNGHLPESLVHLYSEGCTRLCEEQNPNRRDTARRGSLTARQRLRLAGRIAAVTMLANRYAVWTGLETDPVPDEDVRLSELSVGSESGDFQTFDATEDHIREVLDTGLFSSRGPSRIGWAHQSYAEFLAAHYLIAREVPIYNILRLLQHPAGGLLPQLEILASWVASLSRDIHQCLQQQEPLVLLAGDLVNANQDDIAGLTESLLRAYDEGRAHDFILRIGDLYRKLTHPGLAGQLRPYVVNRQRNPVARRAAFMIAETCRVTGVRDELLQVALDPSEEPSARALAASALGSCGDDSAHQLLVPLAWGERGPDPEDEIKGQVLQLLWPRHISAEELFLRLVQPAPRYIGAYVVFLTRQLPGSLRDADLLPALTWATRYVSTAGHTNEYHLKQLATAIFIKAWDRIENPTVTVPVIDYVLTALRSCHALLLGFDENAHVAFTEQLKTNTTRRQRFLQAVATLEPERLQPHLEFSLCQAGLLVESDLPWLLSLTPFGSAADPAVRLETLFALVVATAAVQDPVQFEVIYEAATRWPALWAQYQVFFEGVPLDSHLAESMRNSDRMSGQARRAGPPPLEPPAQVRVQRCLEKFEAGTLDAWWWLNCDLTLTPESRWYRSDFDYRLTLTPGWEQANPDLRRRILSAAERYLADATPHLDEWLGQNTCDRKDLAAYRALILLKEADPNVYAGLSNDIWRKWAPVVIACPKETGTEASKQHEPFLRDASLAAATEVAETVKRLIASERQATLQSGPEAQATDLIPFQILRALDGCWENQELVRLLLDELHDQRNSPAQLGSILERLMTLGNEDAVGYALDILRECPVPIERREHTLRASRNGPSLASPSRRSFFAARFAAAAVGIA